MKLLIQSLIVAAVLAGSYALADTLELADGTLLEGDFVGSSNDIVMFNTGTGIEAYPEAEVVSAGVGAPGALMSGWPKASIFRRRFRISPRR